VQEILSGIFHWTAFHEGIGMDVSSYYVEGSGTLIDPMLPAEGLDWFEERRPPERVLLTIRHHYRDSDAFVNEFGIEVWCHEAGLHEFEGGPQVRGYSAGDTLAPGIQALDFVGLSPDDTALRIEATGGALAFGDALVHFGGGRIGFVPDDLIGDDPEAIKRELRTGLEALLDDDFEHLLFAHGEPLTGSGRRAFEALLGR
jgi:glyoxylase-like metal-dependent hydrolase (beta-lactamase superfamily II)